VPKYTLTVQILYNLNVVSSNVLLINGALSIILEIRSRSQTILLKKMANKQEMNFFWFLFVFLSFSKDSNRIFINEKNNLSNENERLKRTIQFIMLKMYFLLRESKKFRFYLKNLFFML
jgi:hypothetical protein